MNYFKNKPTIHQVSISDLNPAPYNPRKWGAGDMKYLIESIKKFGFVDPILVNKAKQRKNVVIGGHFRLEVAKRLGMEDVPVVFLNISNIEKEKELNLRLNRNTGKWDFELLKKFDMNLLLDIGFDESDLGTIWSDLLSIEDDKFDMEEKFEELGEVTVKLGDIYTLGRHRLMCGDSTSAEDVSKLMQKKKSDVLFCDPPYNIGLDYSAGIGGKRQYSKSEVNDGKSKAEYSDFLYTALEVGLKYCHQDCHSFWWCDEQYIGLLQSLAEKSGLTNKRVCLWIKNNQNATPKIAFNKIYEPCVYSIRGKPYLNTKHNNLHEVMNPEIETGNRTAEDILDLLNIWLVKRLPANEYQHPTQKPPQLLQKPLLRCSKVGNLVLDLFGGSGSTLIACEQLQRTAYLMEIDPRFCSLILSRYEELTGNTPRKIN